MTRDLNPWMALQFLLVLVLVAMAVLHALFSVLPPSGRLRMLRAVQRLLGGAGTGAAADGAQGLQAGLEARLHDGSRPGLRHRLLARVAARVAALQALPAGGCAGCMGCARPGASGPASLPAPRSPR